MRNFWIVMRMPTFREDVEDMVRRNRLESKIKLDREDIPKDFFISEEYARRYCVELASENPMKAYAVMQINTILETGEPSVVTKRINESGELVIA